MKIHVLNEWFVSYFCYFCIVSWLQFLYLKYLMLSKLDLDFISTKKTVNASMNWIYIKPLKNKNFYLNFLKEFFVINETLFRRWQFKRIFASQTIFKILRYAYKIDTRKYILERWHQCHFTSLFNHFIRVIQIIADMIQLFLSLAHNKLVEFVDIFENIV